MPSIFGIISSDTAVLHGENKIIYQRGEEKYTLVHDGDIYNTNEIRARLMGRGFRLETDSDVLLAAYLVWREQCVKHLNSTASFAVWEAHTSTLFIARDRLGVKPLFYAQKGDDFVFASELKDILAHIPAELNADGIRELVLLGPGRTPGCGVLCGVHELLPAQYGVYTNDIVSTQQYWSYTEAESENMTFADTVEQVRVILTDAITRQLKTTKTLGTFLSGGLDSSIITAVAAQHIDELQTFSLDYQDNDKHFRTGKFQPESDGAYIEAMKRHLGLRHEYIVLQTEDLADALYDGVDARGLPGMADIDTALLLFCKQVKPYIDVTLSGECADELFGGYPWYQLMPRVPTDEILSGEVALPPHSRNIWAKQSAQPRLKSPNQLMPRIPTDEILRGEVTDKTFPWAKLPREQYLKPVFRNNTYVSSRYNKTVSMPDALTAHQAMVKLNTDWFMQTLLNRSDSMSRAAGLEVRVPFCDYRLAKLLYQTPWEYKNYRNREKGLLREAMHGLLPEDVLWRKKSPFPKTHNPAYLAIVQQRLRDVISNNNARILEFIERSALEKLLAETSAVPWYGQLMTTPQTIAYFLQLEYWLDKFNVRLV